MSIEILKKLRELTGAGVADSKQALAETNNDLEKATTWLRKKGEKIAGKRSLRETKQGVIECYVHTDGKKASVVALACETDFVARTPDFRAFAHELALQVVAHAPQYLNPEEVPREVVEKEKEAFRAQLAKEGKPKKMWEKIIEGKLEKFYSEVCLLKQKYIRDDQKTVEQLQTELIAKTGENIRITKFFYVTL